MADLTYTVTVATGNTYPSGSGTGNVYYLNGTRTLNVDWVQGATLRFNQSDSSNDNHPLIFSTNTSTSGIISSGVSYYLDGSSNQSNYINTTTFNAATTRYVEITPSSQTDFYWLCYIHGIGMGGTFNITSNTWGALNYGQGSFAAQGDVGLSVTGSQSTFSIGSVTASGVLQIGWGGDTWGENEWGDLSGSQPIVVGQQLTSSIGTVQENIIVDVDVNVSGIQMAFGAPSAVGGTSVLITQSGLQLTSTLGQQTNAIGVPVTGMLGTMSPGAVTIDDTSLTGAGWGRAEWGEFAWGVNYSAQGTGLQLNSSIGNAVGFSDGAFPVQLPTLTSSFAVPSFSVQIDNDLFVNATEHQITMSTGSPSITGDCNISVSGVQITSSVGNTVGGLKTPVDVTGIQMTSTLGSISLVQTTVESVSGQQATLSLGQSADIPGQIIGVSGQQIITGISGPVITGSAIVNLTGISMTASTSSSNVTPWSEVDPGVNNVWSDVDLAA